MDNQGPTVFRVEKAFDMNSGYQPAEATLSVVYNTTNTNSMEEAAPEAQEAVSTSQVPLITKSGEVESLSENKASERVSQEAPPRSPAPSVGRESVNIGSGASVCTEQCKDSQEKENVDEPAQKTPSQRTSASQEPASHHSEVAPKEEVVAKECALEPSPDSLIERLKSPRPLNKGREDMTFDINFYRDSIAGNIPETTYPKCRIYVMDRRRGAINMVLDTMHSIEAHILCGYVEDQHNKSKLQEVLFKARRIIPPDRKTSLTCDEIDEIMELLCMAKAYVINGCTSK